MILALWALLVLISLALVVVGLVMSDQTAQAIIGFFFLFLLSFPILNGNLEIETGTAVNTTFIYDGNGSVTMAQQSLNYNYNYWNDDLSHNIGYWMIITSSIGLFGVLFSLDRVRMKFEEWRGN